MQDCILFLVLRMQPTFDDRDSQDNHSKAKAGLDPSEKHTCYHHNSVNPPFEKEDVSNG
jgi:hypothetical protein